MSAPRWEIACDVEDVDDGEGIVLEVDPPVAVFLSDGRWFATDDTCSHETASLADGYVDGTEVECPFHFARFCLRTGAALSYPATEPVRSYPVRVTGSVVEVDLSSRDASSGAA